QVSDYETDTAILTDTALPQDLPPPSRTNEELNLAVLKRHNPSIIAILSIAPYAVVYKFSAISSIWEKRGVEGTLFVVQLLPEQLESDQSLTPDHNAISAARFGVVVLNRRGLDNFEAGLKNAEDVEVTEDYVILQVGSEPSAPAHDNGRMQGGEPDIIGLWIFAEPPPSSTSQARILNAQIIQECAKQAEISRKAAEETLKQIRQEQAQTANAKGQPDESEDPAQGGMGSAPMGRQLSLRQLFGQQRQDDDAWSIRGHHDPSLQSTQP
ncbi:PH domain-like protein, partial [Viridothelium virens]